MGARDQTHSAPAAVWTVARTSSAGGLRRGRLLGLLALVGFPVVVALVVWAFGEGRGGGFAGFTVLVSTAYLSFIVPLVLVFLGTAAFGDEWEAGTGPYLVGLPVPRAALVAGRWVAALARALLLVLPAIVLFYLVNLAPHEGAIAHYLPQLGGVLAGLAAVTVGYLAVFLFFGVAVRRCVVASLLYMLAFEFLLAHLPLRLAQLSLAFHARTVLWRLTGEERFIAELADEIAADLPTLAASLTAIGAFTLVFLGAATLVLRRKQITGEAQTEE